MSSRVGGSSYGLCCTKTLCSLKVLRTLLRRVRLSSPLFIVHRGRGKTLVESGASRVLPSRARKNPQLASDLESPDWLRSSLPVLGLNSYRHRNPIYCSPSLKKQHLFPYRGATSFDYLQSTTTTKLHYGQGSREFLRW